jgi:hypothetical protein
MSVHNVPRARWADVLEQFSRGHRGWLASLVTVGPGPELASRTDWYPLESVTVAQTGGRTTAIRVKLQGGATVCVSAPRTLGVDRRDDGAERALEIDAAEGEFVRIAFRATALPEEVDGIAPAELVEPGGSDRVGQSPDQSNERIEERHVGH